MKRFAFGAWLLAGCLLISPGRAGAGEPRGEATRVHGETAVALTHAFTGDDETRNSLLRKIVAESLDAELARWMLGEVRVGEDWMPYRRVVDDTGRWPELYRYQQQREQREDNFRDQLYLADGCRAHKLADEERAHLMRVLRHDWSFEEAHVRLGHVKLGGMWVSPEQILRSARKLQRDEENFVVWKDRIERLHRHFANAKGEVRLKQVTEELHAIRTPDAIPALERIFAARGERETEAYLNWLSRIPSYEAGEAIVRHAVLSDSPLIRVKARKLLADRPYEEYVPWLLSGLETVKEINVSLERDPFALVMLRAVTTVVIDGQSFELSLTNEQKLYHPEMTVQRLRYHANRQLLWEYDLRDRNSRTDLVRQATSRFLNSFDQQTAWLRVSQDLRTQRIQKSLSAATGLPEAANSDAWWNWWTEYNGAIPGGAKLQLADKYDEHWYVSGRGPAPPTHLSIVRCCCVVAGTPIETEHGLRPIQEIKIGDRVLSQDVDTGELTFKPVFDTPVLKSAKLLKITASQEDLTCSLGHPFWVIGRGWRMARELEPGMRFHTLTGTTEVQSVEEAGEGTVHNLIVADFQTYFAGKGRIYTHDVTPRRATDMDLPGLRKTFE